MGRRDGAVLDEARQATNGRVYPATVFCGRPVFARPDVERDLAPVGSRDPIIDPLRDPIDSERACLGAWITALRFSRRTGIRTTVARWLLELWVREGHVERLDKAGGPVMYRERPRG